MTAQTSHEELARLRAAFTVPAAKAPAPGLCPPPERIWLGIRGELPPDELRSLLDHVAACPACVEDWRIAREFGAEADAGRSRWSWMRSGFAAAAAVILVSALGFEAHRQSQPPKVSSFRTTIQTTITPALKPGAPLPRERFVVSWSATGEVATYTFRASLPTELAALYEAKDLTIPEVQIPAEALARLQSGDTVLYLIKAYSPEGIELASTTFDVTVK